MPKSFEYKVLTDDHKGHLAKVELLEHELNDRLNEYGELGWRLVQLRFQFARYTYGLMDFPGYYVAVMEREAEE